MKRLDKMPPSRGGRAKKEGLRTHQIRVLRCLGASKGPLTRGKIQEALGVSSTLVSRALGYEDAKKREAFETADPFGGYPSLLTLEFAALVKLDIDGVPEIAYEITDAGRKAMHETRAVKLPPPRE